MEHAADSAGIEQRLQNARLGVFADAVLRTMQRRVREWRFAAAKKLVFGAGAETTSGHADADAIAGGLSGAIPMRQARSISSWGNTMGECI
jgi:hypothetical protein